LDLVLSGNGEASMMPRFNLDPTAGPHMASDLTDDDLDFLLHVLAIELAIRLDSAAYQQRFHGIADHRTEMDEIVSDWRNQRDRMGFAASVTSDLEGLAVVEDR
jgi:hypothetical protein